MTTMIDLDLFLPDARVYAPMAPVPVVKRFVIWAARELCGAARMWRHTATLSFTDTSPWARLNVEDAEIVEVDEAWGDGRDIEAVRPRQLDAMHPGWQDDVQAGAARYITELTKNRIRIWPVETVTLQARLILKPSRDAIEMPEFLLDNHGETIAMGAGSRLLTMTNTEFADPQRGLDLRNQFNSKKAGVRLSEAGTKSGAPLRSRGSYL